MLHRRCSVLTCAAVVRSALRGHEVARPSGPQALFPGLLLSHPLVYRAFHAGRGRSSPVPMLDLLGALAAPRQPARLGISGPVALGAAEAVATPSVLVHHRKVHGTPAPAAEVQDPRARTSQAAANAPAPSEQLPPLTVVLDMDETMLHTVLAPAGGAQGVRQEEERSVATRLQGLDYFDHKFQWEGVEQAAVVRQRPHLRTFLEGLKGLGIQTYVFTAGVEEYASPLLDRVDPDGTLIARRFYRDHCRIVGRFFVKDLAVVGTPLARTVLVDNNPVCFVPQPENGVPVPSFYDDPNDAVLPALLDLLRDMRAQQDVRAALADRFQLAAALANAGLTMSELAQR